MLINNALNFCIQFYTGLFGYLFERRLCDRKCIALKIVKKSRYKKNHTGNIKNIKKLDFILKFSCWETVD